MKFEWDNDNGNVSLRGATLDASELRLMHRLLGKLSLSRLVEMGFDKAEAEQLYGMYYETD